MDVRTSHWRLTQPTPSYLGLSRPLLQRKNPKTTWRFAELIRATRTSQLPQVSSGFQVKQECFAYFRILPICDVSL